MVDDDDSTISNKKSPLDYDMALFRAGGCGIAQYLVGLIVILAFLTKGWIVYGLPYLEKIPQYECNNDKKWAECSRDHIC